MHVLRPAVASLRPILVLVRVRIIRRRFVNRLEDACQQLVHRGFDRRLAVGAGLAPRVARDAVDAAELPALSTLVPDFELLVDDLAAVPDAELRRRALAPFPRIALWLLRDGRNVAAFFEHLVAWGAELDRLAGAPDDPADIEVVVRYILRVAGDEPFQTLRQRIIDVAPGFEASMSSIEEQLMERGREQGREQGLQQALEAMRDVLARQLALRFGALDAPSRAKIDAAPQGVLDRWFERTVTAASLAEVFDD